MYIKLFKLIDVITLEDDKIMQRRLKTLLMLIQKYICKWDMIELLDSIFKKKMRAIHEY
ncbi:MAG: Rpn family recombination-promoting nuclease/putative transposase [Arsenophonus sp. NC-PG7-MAG3]